MSGQNRKGPAGNAAIKPEPGKPLTKKLPAHRKVIQDAANYSIESSNTDSHSQNPAADDYEQCKVSKSKKENYREEVNMVKDLDRWG